MNHERAPGSTQASCATLDCRVLLFDADGVDRVVTLDRQQLDALSGNLSLIHI